MAVREENWTGERADEGQVAQQSGENEAGPSRSGSWRVMKVIGLMLLMIALVLGAAAAIYFVGLAREAPRAGSLDRSALDRATIIYTSSGEVITRYFDKNRTWVGLEEISPEVTEALIATEDRRFYEHGGIDWRRTLAAVYQTLTGQVQGGSTITMQLARNIFPELKEDPMIERKIKEWVVARRLEDTFSKDEILETYLNTVPFVYRAYGIEAAALTYFDKHAEDLNTLEAATLVGMLKGPSFYNPVDHPGRSRARRNVVLENMVEAGFLAQGEMRRLRAQETPADFHPVTPENNLAPYFAEHVRRQLDAWAEDKGYNLYTSGLRVYTTLDAALQREAEPALESTLEDLQAVVDVSWSAASVPFFSQGLEDYERARERIDPFRFFWRAHPGVTRRLVGGTERHAELVAKGLSAEEATDQLIEEATFVDSVQAAAERLQGGFVALDPDDGHVKAWVGGRGFANDQFDHVAQAMRQPGSTFKPFVYAAALANGFTPDDVLLDRQFRYVNEKTGQTWAPGNFGGETSALMSLREALTHSKNTITAQLVMRLGPERVAEYARQMGIQSELSAVPSIGLGTSPVSLLEMTVAYTTIADLGTYHAPVAITRIENRRGEVIERFAPASREAIDPAVAYGVRDMMRDVVGEGTGIRIRHQYEATGELAGKTGTTQRGADGWFMLIHPELVMGSWVGFDLPELTFRTNWWGQGAHTALHTTGRFYDQVEMPDETFDELPALQDLSIDFARLHSDDAPTGVPWEALLPEAARPDSAQLGGWRLPPAARVVRPDLRPAERFRFPAGGDLSTDELNRLGRRHTKVDEYLDELDQ